MSVIVNPTGGGGGGGMSIGGSVVGGTAPAILFINPNGVLAQDPSNFGWDSTHKILLIEGQSALYRVPNASGDNWFEGAAGNLTLSGFANFGTGPNCLTQLTSGAGNMAVGFDALFSVTTGTNNVGIGTNAGLFVATGTQNMAIGANTLRNGDVNFNTAIGSGALSSCTGDGNVAIGRSSLGALNSGGVGASSNVGIGNNAGNSMTTGSFCTFIGGSQPGGNILAAQNITLVGGWQAPNLAFVSNIIALTDGNPSQSIFGVDMSWTASNVWSFQQTGSPQGLHVYNTTDGLGPSQVNYERGCLDWNLTSNVFRLATQAGGTGTVRIIAIDGFQKAGAPAAGDLPSGTWGLINDTSGGNTWLCYNNSGTIRKVQLT